MRLHGTLAAGALLAMFQSPALAGDPTLLGYGIGAFDETFLDPRLAYFKVDYNRPHYPAGDNRLEVMGGYNLLPTPEIFPPPASDRRFRDHHQRGNLDGRGPRV